MPDPVLDASPDVLTETTFAADNVRAISWMMLSVLGSSAMTIAVRQVSLELDPSMVTFLRFSITAALLLAWLILSRTARQGLQFSRPWMHVSRGLCMGFSALTGFYAIANLELVTVTVLFFAAPIFATVFAGFVHGEHAGPRRLAAVGIGFLGVLVVLRPGIDSIQPAMLSALCSSVLFALALVQSRAVAQADGSFSALFSSVTITALVSVPFAIPVWQIPTMGITWIAAAALVLTGILRLFADIQAYRFGEAASLAPMTYLRLVLIGGGGYLIYGEVPDSTAVIGAAIIIGAAIYIARREARIRKRNSTEA